MNVKKLSTNFSSLWKLKWFFFIQFLDRYAPRRVEYIYSIVEIMTPHAPLTPTPSIKVEDIIYGTLLNYLSPAEL